MTNRADNTSDAEVPHEYFGVFDLFKIGIGPSSSHSVGPMIAAGLFLRELKDHQLFQQCNRVRIDLYGSLALTGIGHGTDLAVIMGLAGEHPETIDPEKTADRIKQIRSSAQLRLGSDRWIRFLESEDLWFHRTQFLPAHPNGLTFSAFADQHSERALYSATYYSVCGGFVVPEISLQAPPSVFGVSDHSASDDAARSVPFPFTSGNELLNLTRQQSCSISDLAWKNELAFRSQADIESGLNRIWQTMQDCVHRGCQNDGILPGGLNIERRAPDLYRSLSSQESPAVGHSVISHSDPMNILDWVDLYALAVNEENAAGGRVVTAPTNGAAGIIPAVLHYYDRHCPGSTPDGIHRFLLTAAMIGSLYKRNASISGAEVGCQGEVGVACSMAAGALTEVLGGTPEQVEEAAEIGMEHNLGLTCDPIRGLVQVPCIERNAMGAVKAINASRLALRGDGRHFVSLDRVIRVMKRTGADMSSRYKETSRGGLAVNISEC